VPVTTTLFVEVFAWDPALAADGLAILGEILALSALGSAFFPLSSEQRPAEAESAKKRQAKMIEGTVRRGDPLETGS